MVSVAIRWGWREQPPIAISSGRRRHRCSSSSAGSFVGLIAVALIGISSAFVSPTLSSHTIKSFSPAVSMPSSTGEIISHAKIRGKIRSAEIRSSTTSLLVSLESPSTTTAQSSESDNELPDVALIDSNGQSNATSMPDISKDLDVTLSPEVFIPLGETDERHMERLRMGDDVEELTHLLQHDEVDLQRLLSPSIPISYDAHGIVQADAVYSTNNAIAMIEANGAMATSDSDEPEYPAFIKFLFQKDANGQTLASKLFNVCLLAVSFGYVIVSVFNIDHGMTRGWSPAEIGMRIPLDTWASYENSLSEKPVATKTIINIVIYLLGDWLSQTLFQEKNILDFDAGRTLKNGFIGMCFGPVVHEYYEFSDWILPVDGVTIGLTNRAFKILMDQTVYLSIKCSIYILAIGVLNGDSVKDSSDNVKNRIKPIMFAAWKFWPLVHCVTYGLVPARHRILWVNSVDLVWNAILASKARNDDDDDGEGSDDSEGGSEGFESKNGESAVNNGESDMFVKISSILSSLDDSTNHDAELNKSLITNGEEVASSDDNILGAQWEDESSDTKTLLVKD